MANQLLPYCTPLCSILCFPVKHPAHGRKNKLGAYLHMNKLKVAQAATWDRRCRFDLSQAYQQQHQKYQKQKK